MRRACLSIVCGMGLLAGHAAGADMKPSLDPALLGHWSAHNPTGPLTSLSFDASGRATLCRKDGLQTASTSAKYQVFDGRQLEITMQKEPSGHVQSDIYRIETLANNALTLIDPDGARLEFRRRAY